MPGSTVHVTNLPPPAAAGVPEAPVDGLLYGRRAPNWEEIPPGRRLMRPTVTESFNRLVDAHTSDENAKGLISEFLADDRPDLALMVLLIAKR